MEVKTPDGYLAELEGFISKKAKPMVGKMRETYKREFQTAINQGESDGDIRMCIWRIANEWDRIPLTLQQARVDVLRGFTPTPPVGKCSPTEGYEDFFGLSDRQQKVLSWMGKIGRDEALKRMRGSSRYQQEVY